MRCEGFKLVWDDCVGWTIGIGNAICGYGYEEGSKRTAERILEQLHKLGHKEFELEWDNKGNVYIKLVNGELITVQEAEERYIICNK